MLTPWRTSTTSSLPRSLACRGPHMCNSTGDSQATRPTTPRLAGDQPRPIWVPGLLVTRDFTEFRHKGVKLRTFSTAGALSQRFPQLPETPGGFATCPRHAGSGQRNIYSCFVACRVNDRVACREEQLRNRLSERQLDPQPLPRVESVDPSPESAVCLLRGVEAGRRSYVMRLLLGACTHFGA